MPELPEIEHLRRTLAPALAEATVTSVKIIRPDVIEGCRTQRSLLRGARGLTVHRHGKQLAVVAGDGRACALHMGMTGALLVTEEKRTVTQYPIHTHICWRLLQPDGRRSSLRFIDPRRFGGLWTFDSFEDLRNRRWRNLGPDALTISAHALRVAFARTRVQVKAALLNQSVLAGVGNIYADESLFRARIHPTTPAKDIQKDDVRHLAASIRSILRSAIRAGGSTLRDYRDSRGRSGGFQFRHRVYGRGGEVCCSCGASLASGMIAQRTTVWCPRCQGKPST